MLAAGAEVGKYLIKGFLGNGHFGHVYHVLDRALSVERALKVLKISDPTKLVELLEAQIQYKCRHANCVTVNGADIHILNNEPHVCIDMELISGGSLESLISKEFLSVKNSCRIINEVSYGIEHAHNQGVLHKDIKPGNIMLSDNTGKVSDFGISQYVGVGGVGSGFAYTTHQPPEFFTSGVITAQSDVFSLGITLYRCANNIEDWRSAVSTCSNPEVLLAKGKLLQSMGWQPWVPAKLQKIVSKACFAEPARRFKSIKDFRQALDKLHWNLDWVRIDQYSWQASGSAVHLARLTGKDWNTFEYLVNNRRRIAECQTFGTAEDAQRHLWNFVASSTLA